ncbi:hypothetical protein BU14_0027s0042 [Porphyra umbilicalis]|uniref:S-formylglutathione hydrolase n=1 Tax=Porphyra umbilicalis TaxID=2786 RepID=A0A1X6PJS2_PORUM|nr:hypothetical protein BU14_0027s0042 [Porphyra umbilicalis]|eukprot:OSX81016.1 hypothetical protein BU14_0027s0042 [Porphyra umbilicalis]
MTPAAAATATAGAAPSPPSRGCRASRATTKTLWSRRAPRRTWRGRPPPLLLVVPDTSPRGAGAPGQDGAEEAGTGAAWWLDASSPGWGAYQMESFVVDELLVAVAAALAPRGGTSGGGGGGWTLDPSRRSVSGHSVGGYGALAFATRRRAASAAVTAVSPVAHPAASDWGATVFGTDVGPRAVAAAAWAAADPTDAMASGGAPAGDPPPPIAIEPGTADGLSADGALRGDDFFRGGGGGGAEPCALRLRRGYDHILHFVATFLGETVAAHAAALAAAGGGGGWGGGGAWVRRE